MLTRNRVGSGLRPRRRIKIELRKERSLAEEGDWESSRLFYGADMPGDAHIHLNTIRAEAKAMMPIHLKYGMSVGSPVKNVETSSPAPTRHARSNAPQRLATHFQTYEFHYHPTAKIF